MLRNGINGLLACLFVFTMSEGGWMWAQALSTQAAVPEHPKAVAEHPKKDAQSYVVGPDDQVTIWVLECDEITGKTFTIDKSGSVSLPLVGRMHVAGLTVEQFEVALRDRLHRFLRDPEVSITVTDFRSQPVSVIGAVNRPGVYQLRGGRTLLDALTEAGGLRADAGTTGRLERGPEWGRIPLADATTDPASGGSVAEINIRKILASGDSEGNIDLRPHDVISVPASEMVYVIGEISKPGSFAVHENGSLSILQAISMAGGFTKIAAPHARGPLNSDFTREPTAPMPAVSKCPPIARTAMTPSFGSDARPRGSVGKCALARLLSLGSLGTRRSTSLPKKNSRECKR